MYEFEGEIKGRHVEITASAGDEMVEYSGVVRRVYSNFIAIIEDGTGRVIFINQEKITSLLYDPEDDKPDEKKKRKLFG